MFYEDLSPYSYSAAPTGLPGVVNVGWLDSTVPRTGDVGHAIRGRLTRLAQQPALLTRGHHRCGICGNAEGNGELWVMGANGGVHAAPTMILHYVTDHRYAPPATFMDAVVSADSPLTDRECKARISAHRRKLEEAPTIEDILVPFFATKIYWRREDFVDLGAFDDFVKRRFGMRFNSIAMSERGYFVRTECENPRVLLHALAAEIAASPPGPFECSYRLLYVGGEEQTFSLEHR